MLVDQALDFLSLWLWQEESNDEGDDGDGGGHDACCLSYMNWEHRGGCSSEEGC